MPHATKVIAAMALCLSPVAAPAYDGTSGRGVWTQVRTVQGCLIYWQWHPSFETEPQFQRNSEFSFEGSGCQPNRVLTGQGKLIWHRMNLPGNSEQRHGYMGRIVNGLLEGEVSMEWNGGEPERMSYSGGCERATQAEGECQPFSGSPTSYAAQVDAPAGAAGQSSTPTAATHSGCVTMGPSSDTLWQVMNNCPHPVIGRFCYENDRYHNCGQVPGMFGPLAPGRSQDVSGPTSQGPQWRVTYCNFQDFPRSCTIANP